MHHGFEDWLKFEMAALLCREPWNYERWHGEVPGDVGLEYRAVLSGKETKLVDLWASPFRSTRTATAKRWHFLELKVAFNNANAAKQFASWRADFEMLTHLDRRYAEQRPCSVASVVFGVGFEKAKFERESSRACRGLSGKPVAHNVKTDSHPLRIHALVE